MSGLYGLSAVVQVIVVSVDVTLPQTLSSIRTVVVAEVEKPVPVNVIDSPPRTEPNLSLMLVSTGVEVESNVTASKSVATPSSMSLGVHE